MEPRLLRPAQSIQTDTGHFWGDGHNRCDDRGDIFIHDDPGFTGAKRVLRLTADDDYRPTQYKLPEKWAKDSQFIAYDVVPSGKIWMLTQAADHSYQLFGITSDSEEPSETDVEVPDHVFVIGITVSQTGGFLLSGFFDGKAADDYRGKRFIAFYDASGRVIKRLDSPALGEINLSDTKKHLMQNGLTTGSDGNFYFVSNDKILVFSPAGEQVRSFYFDKPDPSVIPIWLAISGGLVSIEFVKEQKDGVLSMTYLVLDQFSGEPYGLYVPSPEAGHNASCFSRGLGYTFLNLTNGKLRVITAPLS
jgi:hypothetical protein